MLITPMPPRHAVRHNKVHRHKNKQRHQRSQYNSKQHTRAFCRRFSLAAASQMRFADFDDAALISPLSADIRRRTPHVDFSPAARHADAAAFAYASHAVDFSLREGTVILRLFSAIRFRDFAAAQCRACALPPRSSPLLRRAAGHAADDAATPLAKMPPYDAC